MNSTGIMDFMCAAVEYVTTRAGVMVELDLRRQEGSFQSVGALGLSGYIAEVQKVELRQREPVLQRAKTLSSLERAEGLRSAQEIMEGELQGVHGHHYLKQFQRITGFVHDEPLPKAVPQPGFAECVSVPFRPKPAVVAVPGYKVA